MFAIIRSILFLGVITLFSVGCGSSNPNVAATVRGTISYNGAPVTGGMVVYYSKTGAGVFRSDIDREGSYQINDVAVGDYEVTVETESINPNKKQEEYKGASGGGASSGGSNKYGKGGGSGSPPSGGGGKSKTAMKSSPMPDYAPQNKGEYMKIPGRYADKEKSGLTAKLSSGSQKVDFPLSD